MKIYVDADACPVKDMIIEVGEKYNINICMVCSISHYGKFNESVEYIIVDNIPQAADIALINRVRGGDIVITQDYGLASLVLKKGCTALHHTGKKYTEDNIEELLLKRHISQKIRKSGGRTKGPKPFMEADKIRFKEALIKAVLFSRQE